MTFFLLAAVFVLVLVWQRDVLTRASYDRVSAVATVQEERVDEYVDSGLTAARVVATRPAVLDVLSGEPASPDRAHSVLQGFVDVTPELSWAGAYDRDLSLIVSAGDAPPVPDDYLVPRHATFARVADSSNRRRARRLRSRVKARMAAAASWWLAKSEPSMTKLSSSPNWHSIGLSQEAYAGV